MPTTTPNMGLPIPTHADVDAFIDNMKAKWLETRDRDALCGHARTLRTMAALAADEAKASV